MGQRHQAFVIARVTPHGATQPRYRCIAAFHHQWCYGRLPLRATRRFLTLAKQKDNAEIIRSEIRNTQGKYGVWKEQPKMPDVPCPYTALLLATSWTTDLENPKEIYVTGVSFKNAVLEADMGSGEGDNNDGISVIDITDPESPAYCFVSVNGTESSKRLNRRIPLSGAQYARAYYPVPTSKELEDERIRLTEEDVLRVIATLDGEKMVTQEMLAEAWPSEYQAKLEKLRAKAEQSTPSEDTAAPATIPSLADLTMRPAVSHALETGDATQIEEMLWMPGKAKLVQSILRDMTPFPDSGVPLLEKVINQEMKVGDAAVDLSEYALSSTQVHHLISSVGGVKSLNLSYNPVVTTQTVHQILTATPSLTRLVLLGCTAITNEGLKNLLVTDPKLFYRLEALIHPFLLSNDSSYANAFSFNGLLEDRWTITSCSLAIFTPSNIVQALTDFLQGYAYGNSWDSSQLLTSELAPQSAFCAAYRKPEQKWGARNVVAFPRSSIAALNGEGWAFVLDLMSTYGPSDESAWGFVRKLKHSESEGPKGATPDAPSFEVHDLRSFLATMVEEGRPPVSEKAVDELEEILKSMGMRLLKVENMVQLSDKAVRFAARSVY